MSLNVDPSRSKKHSYRLVSSHRPGIRWRGSKPGSDHCHLPHFPPQSATYCVLASLTLVTLSHSLKSLAPPSFFFFLSSLPPPPLLQTQIPHQPSPSIASESMETLPPKQESIGVHKAVLAPGNGTQFPKAGDKVTIHYVGTLQDGSK